MAIDISNRPNKNIRRINIPSKQKNDISFTMLIVIALSLISVDCLTNIFVNHINTVLYILLKFIGQAAIPLMCFITAQSYMHTNNSRSIAITLGILTVVSHIPYVLLNTGEFIILTKTSLMLPMFLGYSSLMIRDMLGIDRNVKSAVILLVCLVSMAGQGGCIAVVWIYIFGSNFSKDKEIKYLAVTGTVMVIINFILNLSSNFWWIVVYQFGFSLAIPFIMRHNSAKSKAVKKDFYKITCYPIVIFLFAVIRCVIY